MIPKTILQTSKNPYPQYVSDMWKQRIDNTWKIEWFSDDDILKFFDDNPLPEFPKIKEVFHSFTDGGHKADLFRYYYLYLNGGFFIDSDIMTHVHMDTIYSPDHDHIFVFADVACNRLCHPEIDSPVIFNGLMGCVPRSEIVYEALHNAYTVKLRLLEKQRLYFVYMLYVIAEKHKHNHKILYYNEIMKDAHQLVTHTTDDRCRRIATHYFGGEKIIPENVELYTDDKLVVEVEGRFRGKNFPFKVHNPWHDHFVSTAIYLDGAWEPRISDLIVSSMKPGGVFVDIGANLGWHTKIVQNEGYDVISFEPEPENFNVLKQNCTKDGSTMYELALGEREEVLSIERNPTNYGDSFISDTGTNQVKVVRLDDLLDQDTISRVNVVKMDVQGFETKVINGAFNFFNTLKKGTTIIIEVSPWNKNCDLSVIRNLVEMSSDSYVMTFWTNDILNFDKAIDSCRNPRENGVPERLLDPTLNINLEFDLVLIK